MKKLIPTNLDNSEEIEKFLRKTQTVNLIQEEKENMYRPIKCEKNIELICLKILQRKVQAYLALHVNSTEHL